MADGVGTEEKKEEQEEADQSTDRKDEFKILEGRGREYTISGKKVVQKPLVLRDFSRLVEHFIDLIGAIAATNPEMIKGDFNFDTAKLTPDFFVGLAHCSKEATEKVYDILAMVLNEDRDFLLDNLGLSEFTCIMADAVELNNLKEVLANFQRMGHQIRQHFKK